MNMTNLMSSPLVMIMPVVAISVLRRPQQRFYSVTFIGRPFFEMHMLIAHLVCIARG